jgi:hypothetical protein
LRGEVGPGEAVEGLGKRRGRLNIIGGLFDRGHGAISKIAD